MPVPVYSALDYLIQVQRLLPRGRVWHRGVTTAQAQQLLTLMPTVVRLNQRAADLITDAFPCSTSELLPEWEASLGLPDACTGPLETLQQRQAAVCAKFASRGGQSIAYYVAVAEALGYPITIKQYAPFRVGINRVGDQLYDEEWAHAWRVTAPPTTVRYFRVGQSAVGEALASWGNELLECTIKALAPAHTAVFFVYIQESYWDNDLTHYDAGDSRWDYVVPATAEPQATMMLRAPASLLRAVADRARTDGVRLARLFQRMWDAMNERD